MIKLNWKEVETSQTIRGECRPRYSSQSFTMACGINVIVVIVACATAASAVLAPFPHGKTTVYNYRTEVRTTTSNESIYASQFVLQGTLDVTHDTRDPEQTNAYNFVLSNVVTDMHNGEIMDYDGKPVLQSIDGDAEVIQAPFLIIYNTNGTFQALKFGGDEPRWSKNMKMAIAAMLQLDLPNENLANEPHSFVAQEKTIYGDCSVTYNVHPIERANSNAPEEFRVNKTFSPIDCDGFAVQEFNNVDNDHCKAKKPEDMFTESTRDVEIEKQGDGILIKKLNAYGVVRVLSANGASYPHFVVTNTMFEFIRVKEKSENDAQLGNFVTSPKIDHLTYRKPNANYAPNAAVDVTQGRHVLNVSRLSSHLEELLVQAFNYIDGDHFNPKEMNWNHVQTINKILHTMRYMDVDALQATFDRFENSDLRRNIQIKNIFLGVVAQVGTPASCHFTRNIILKNKISALSAVDMLTKLPLSVKVPTTELLAQMEDLAKFGAAIPAEVRKAGILSFASLIYRTFKNLPHPETNAVLNKYLHDFFDHVKNEPTNEMKVVYLMGIKNIQIGKIYDLLEPIIKGTQVITEDPERFLLLTIWAIDKAVEEDYTVANRILWPLMVNNTLSTKVRIAAYDILMNQAPDEKTARKVHEYVSTEGNEHFYNYHYTTLDSIARSVDQCKNDFRTIVKSILEETQYPRDADANIHYPLSGIHSISYASSGYTYAEKTDIGIVVNEFTGDSEVIKLEHETVDNDGSISDLSILVHIEGPDDFLRLVLPRFYPRLETPEVLEVLQKANSSVPAMKQPMMDIVLMRKGRVVIANHYNFETLEEISDNVLAYYFRMTGIATYNYQHVVFDRLYEKQLTSDIGVPIIIETRVPSVTSMQINHTNLIQRLPNFDVDIKFMKWMHGDYSMSVYNPMKDVWHAVRSVTATEVKLPFHSHITFGRYPNVLQFNFRDQVESKPEVAGFVILAKRLVTVDEEGTQKLMESCHTCLNQEYVYDGSRLVNETGKHRENNFDLKSLGLTGSSYTYRSEYGFLSERDLGYVKVLKTLFKSNISNSWMDVISETAMDARRLMTLITFDAQESLGGCIFRLEPSSQYPISEFNFNVRGKMEDNDKNETTGELLHSQTFRNSISFNTISSLTNTTAGSLNIDVDVDLSRGHLTNKASVQITKKTPEEQNLKICVDFSKNYPAPPADILKLGSTKEEIDSKITVSYGYTDGEECVQNETVISLTAKAQLSDEQKMRFKNDLENSVCNKQTKSPLYANPKNVVPRTVDCLNEAILYTTPRKYTVDVSHKMLSPRFASVVYDSLTDGVVPSETGNFQFRAEFPMTKNNIDFQFMTNTSGFRNLIFPLRKLRDNDEGPVLKPLWDFPMGNSRFDLKFLHDYNEDNIRFCSVYPEIVHRGDGDKLPFTIPSDEWVLISGDHFDNQFAIFAKQPRPNFLSFQVFIRDHRVHIFTRESDNALVAIGDGLEPATEESFRLPTDTDFIWRLKVTKDDDHFVVRTLKVPMTLHIGSNYIAVAFESDLQGHVSGLCGHFNGNTFSSKSDVYSTKDIDSIK